MDMDDFINEALRTDSDSDSNNNKEDSVDPVQLKEAMLKDDFDLLRQVTDSKKSQVSQK